MSAVCAFSNDARMEEASGLHRSYASPSVKLLFSKMNSCCSVYQLTSFRKPGKAGGDGGEKGDGGGTDGELAGNSVGGINTDVIWGGR